MANISSSSIDENIPSVSELNSRKILFFCSIELFLNLLKYSAELQSPDRIAFKIDNMGLPLAAGLIGSRLQGHTMNSKEHPLQKAGYDYGDTLWGNWRRLGLFFRSKQINNGKKKKLIVFS